MRQWFNPSLKDKKMQTKSRAMLVACLLTLTATRASLLKSWEATRADSPSTRREARTGGFRRSLEAMRG